jgi:biopolymer transport protein TolQ
MNMITLSPLISLSSALALEAGFSSNVVQMIIHAGPVVKVVLLILFLFSIISWAIIFMKWRYLRKAGQDTAYFLDLFWESTALNQIYQDSEDLDWSPVAQLFRSGYTELRRAMKLQNPSTSWESARQPIMDNVERSLKKTTIDQGSKMERALSFLATTGNTTPFIGLFGTVWGIMEAFRGIGMKGSASLAVVAPGISEALIATAVGLGAAIPAVIAFNTFSNRVTVLRSEMETFSSDFLSLVERQVVKKKQDEKED